MFPEDMVDSIEPISKMRKMIEERTYDCSQDLVKEVKDNVQKMSHYAFCPGLSPASLAARAA